MFGLETECLLGTGQVLNKSVGTHVPTNRIMTFHYWLWHQEHTNAILMTELLSLFKENELIFLNLGALLTSTFSIVFSIKNQGTRMDKIVKIFCLFNTF